MKKQQIDDIEEGGMVELEEDGMVWRTVEKDVNKREGISQASWTQIIAKCCNPNT